MLNATNISAKKRKYNRRIQSDFKEETCLRSLRKFWPVSVDTDMISEGISSGSRIKEFSTRHAPAMPGRNVKRSRVSGRLSYR
jgi:hypothetical protein